MTGSSESNRWNFCNWNIYFLLLHSLIILAKAIKRKELGTGLHQGQGDLRKENGEEERFFHNLHAS